MAPVPSAQNPAATQHLAVVPQVVISLKATADVVKPANVALMAVVDKSSSMQVRLKVQAYLVWHCSVTWHIRSNDLAISC